MLLSGEVRIFCRKLDDMTGTYPDCAAAIPRCFKPSQVRCEALDTTCGTFIVDAEIVPIVDPDPSAADLPTDNPELARPNGKGKILPFLVLSTRKRTEVTAKNATVRASSALPSTSSSSAEFRCSKRRLPSGEGSST